MNRTVDVKMLFRLWYSEATTVDAAKQLGVTQFQLYALARRYALGKRPIIRPKKPEPELSQEEFDARRLEVQSRWSDEERERRRVGPTARSWRLPSYAFDGRVCAFARTDLD